jgi:hypothetical protein
MDGRLRASILAVCVTGAITALAATAISGPRAGASVALGCALATANFWALARIVAALLPGTTAAARSQSRAAWVTVAMVKMVGVLSLAWLLMRCGLVTPLGMLYGFCGLPIGIAIGSLVSDRSVTIENR